MKADPQAAKKISSLCGKLKSAWALYVGFETRLDGLLPEILTLPSDQIDACYEKIAKGDAARERCMVPIACEHLFHPSLHHRIKGWLEDESLQFRDKVLAAIGRFRLHEFAHHLNGFFFYQRPESEYLAALASLSQDAALRSAALLKLPKNLIALQEGLGWENTAENRNVAHYLRTFPQFDAKPYLQKWFREAQVVDEVGICERYAAGLISAEEHFRLTHDAYVIWRLAEWYGEYERQEVIHFLVEHLHFTESWFTSQKISQTIVCRGRRATEIVARLNGWMPIEYEQYAFVTSLWETLRANPSLAFQAECPVRYESLPKNKTHRLIVEQFRIYGRLLHEDTELGYSLRQTETGDDTILALQVPGWGHWRMMRLSSSDKLLVESGEVPVAHLFHRYSSRGALVAYQNQVILNANDLENKFAAKAIRKLKKREASAGESV
ncbi:hypothetical protein [Roseimicrobium sp. ORNL1]|uniref:hypothetical protein n=1 Tax=Roseimicrobium sp. ORNL1 TaxID=2711231 RepID=UPI0013E2000F|nr:hypothetical protein [Roseimicrobium sp. ORNL1]QIF03153.1 hypothetical protein G5S37_17025 [Roseimicrobium sp. ORNL1]